MNDLSIQVIKTVRYETPDGTSFATEAEARSHLLFLDFQKDSDLSRGISSTLNKENAVFLEIQISSILRIAEKHGLCQTTAKVEIAAEVIRSVLTSIESTRAGINYVTPLQQALADLGQSVDYPHAVSVS